MSLSPAELQRVAPELATLAGARVQKLAQPSERTVALELWQPGKPSVLLLDASPGLARVGVVSRRPPSPPAPFAFQGQLRAHLTGARIDAIEIDATRRSVLLRLSTDDGTRALAVELDPRGGDVLLLDAQGRVLGAGRSDRARLQTHPDATPRGQPWQPPAIGTTRDATRDRLQPVEGQVFPVSAAIDLLYGAATEDKRHDVASTSLRTALRAARKRAERTLEKIDGDARRVEEASRYQRLGDLLKGAVAKLKRGATEVKVVEYGVEGPVDVVVPLLPHLNGRENMERYYRLHRRLSRAVDVVAGRRRTLVDRLARIDDLNTRLDSARDADEVLALADEARNAGLVGSQEAKEKQGKSVATRLPYRTFVSAAGKAIRVGRNARGNDALTFGHARGNDLWLHARGLTGAHVVVPGVGVEGTDGETLLDAATLAAHFSSGKGELVVDVAWTRRKFVGRPHKAAAGAVTYSQEKVLAVRRDDARLERLLASERVDGASGAT